MAWRKWFVRSFVFGVVGSCLLAASVYQQWTNPAAVREQVLANLRELFPGAAISVDSARLRLLGGIQVQELRFVRQDDPDNVDFASVPWAVFHHDKEKLLEGELNLRKVELFRPRIRAYRNPDGTWNLQGILGRPRLDRFLPTLVIHQGTLVLEDRTTSGNVTSLEISDLNLVLINDPLPTLTLEGVAQTALAGKLNVTGAVQRATGETDLTLAARTIPLSTKLLQRLAPWCPTGTLSQLDASGRMEVEARLQYRPQHRSGILYDVRCGLHDVQVQHPNLPVPMEKLTARLRLTDGLVTLEELKAHAGAATLQARGSGRSKCLEEDFEAHVEVQGLSLTEELLSRLPKKAQDLHQLFRPEGEIGLRVAVARREGAWAPLADGHESTVSLRMRGGRASFQKFVYPLTDVAVDVDHHLRTGKSQFTFDARASGQAVHVCGEVKGTGQDFDLSAELRAHEIPIDDTLLLALPETPRQLARSFHVKGRVGVHAFLRHAPGAADFDNRFHVTFKDASVCWDVFPLPLSEVSGKLDILGPRNWEFHGFRGTHRGGILSIHGRTIATPGRDTPGVVAQLDGWQVPLDAALRQALEPMEGLRRTWNVFRPSGRISFQATIHRPTDLVEDLEVKVLAEGATLEPVFFPHRLERLQGIGHFQKNRVTLDKISCQHGDSRWVLPRGTVDLRVGGGYHADLPQLDVANVTLDPDFRKALPGPLRQAAEALNCVAPIRAQARLVIDQNADPDSRPEIYWDASAWIARARLSAGVNFEEVTGVLACRGRHNGHKLLGLEGNVLLEQATAFSQPLRNVQAHFQVREETPDVLLAHVSAPIHDGSISGEVRVDFSSSSTVRYELNLTAAQIDLVQFGKTNLGPDSQVEGKAVGRLYLTGTSAGLDSLEGNGSFDIVGGKLKKLPLLLDLLKFLGLRWPDRTMFEEVHAQFRMQGRRVHMRRLELLGNAVSLTGQGEFNLDGTDLQLDLCPTWARIEQLMPPALRSLPPTLSKQLLVIEVRGRISTNQDDLKFHKKPMPVIVDPLLQVRDRIRGVSPERPTEPLSQLPAPFFSPLAPLSPPGRGSGGEKAGPSRP